MKSEKGVNQENNSTNFMEVVVLGEYEGEWYGNGQDVLPAEDVILRVVGSAVAAHNKIHSVAARAQEEDLRG
jgi:hypothetical protein